MICDHCKKDEPDVDFMFDGELQGEPKKFCGHCTLKIIEVREAFDRIGKFIESLPDSK